MITGERLHPTKIATKPPAGTADSPLLFATFLLQDIMTTNNNSADQGYNGWKNYETWTVSLWLDNDYGAYQQCLDLTQHTQTTQPEAQQAHQLAEKLKQWIEEENPCSGSSLYSDLMNAALSEVNWLEIAEHLLAD